MCIIRNKHSLKLQLPKQSRTGSRNNSSSPGGGDGPGSRGFGQTFTSISSSGGEFVSKHCRLPQLLTVLVEGMNTRLWICNPITSLTWLQLKEDPGLRLLWFLAGIRERNYVISSLRWQDYSWHLSTKHSTFIISRSKTSHICSSSSQQCYSHATGTPSLKRLGQKQEA